MEQTSEDLLAQQLNQLTHLLALLEKEKQVLQTHSPEDLTAVTLEKNTLLLAVQETDTLFSQHPSFKQEKASGIHQKTLESIEDLLQQCKKLNTVNGMIIQQSQISVAKMKTSLLTNSNRSSMTYDNKGKTSGTLKSLDIKA